MHSQKIKQPIFLSLNDKSADDYWSMAFLKDTIDGLKLVDRDLIIVPGEYQDVSAINTELNKYSKILLVVASDEEGRFDIDAISHPDIIIYSMYPNKKFKNVDYWLPLGYTPHTRDNLKLLGLPDKSMGWFFSGQITHDSRRQLASKLINMRDGELVQTEGFTQGLPKEEYIKKIWESKVVPSASGPVCSEAFRTYEALEAGTIPIPEGRATHEILFGEMPFVVLEDWNQVGNYISDYISRYPVLHNEVYAWWQLQKRQIKERFKKDLGIKENITVVVPTSPIVSHPETKIIEETVNSIRNQLPRAEIIITFDGIRKEQLHLKQKYEEYKKKMLWMTNFGWSNVTPLVFQEQMHQSGMIKEALKYINTKLILYVEHDTPLTKDAINWASAINTILNDNLNVVRFFWKSYIPDELDGLMLDKEPIKIRNCPIVRTAQWSQRPHLASTEYYRKILQDYFSDNSNCFIEDLMQKVTENSYLVKGKAGWNEHKIGIYAPNENLKRSYHLDGREDAEKFDDKQIF